MKFDIFGFMLEALKTILKMLSSILMPLLLVALTVFLVFICIFIYHYLYFRLVENIQPKKASKIKNNEPSLIKKIFWLFPKQMAYDKLTIDPEAFGEFGIHLICGEQGSGKTFTAIYLLKKWLNRYPKLKVNSNIDISFQDGKLETWRDIITQNNGIYGIANFIDEMPTWLYSSNESKDVPPELLGEISQQRKQKKAILGTAQVFGKLAKPLREQTHFVYRPYTIFNALTIVFTTKACYYDDVHDRWRKKTGFFIIAHTRELRDAYDTFEKVQRYAKTEFVTSIYSSNSPCGSPHESARINE